MKTALKWLVAALLMIVGLVFLWLGNTGFVSLSRPYVVRESAELTPAQQSVAFTNVNVIPMDVEAVLSGQTVLVQNGRISQVGPAGQVAVPDDTLVIDGHGRYLMPGLADMHVHVKEENELLLFLAHGVTTVRDMWGTTGLQLWLGFPDQLKLRAQIQDGELLGPTLYTAGPVMEGEPRTTPLMTAITSPEQAAASVRQQKDQGYDFIKVYDYPSPEVYAAILETAREVGLSVAGHAPKNVPLEDILVGGQVTIEHLSGFIDSDAAAYRIPESRLADYAVMTREAGVWMCPTINVYQMHVADEDLPALESRSEMAYVSPRMKTLWRRLFRPGAMQNISYEGDYPARIEEMFLHTTRVLHDNGVGLIACTDADNPYLVSGVSLLDELDDFVKAGLTPYEALKAGTINAAEALGHAGEFGQVTPGARADLLLLEGNPLDDVANVRERTGVMVRGRWFPEAELQSMMAELVASYQPSWLDRLWPLTIIGLAAVVAGYTLRSGKKRDECA